MQPDLQSLPDRSVMDRADQAVTRVSRLASSDSLTALPALSGTRSGFTARMGVTSLSRCSARTVLPAAGATV